LGLSELLHIFAITIDAAAGFVEFDNCDWATITSALFGKAS